jgi:ElaB/YqjD/DUF883 family membrane-anchored ribosome-binding protein
MAASLLEKTVQAGAEAAQFGASRLKTVLEETVQDGVTATKRLAMRGRNALEDGAEQTAHRIKRDPLRSVAIACGIGFGLGVLGVWLASRRKSS